MFFKRVPGGVQRPNACSRKFRALLKNILAGNLNWKESLFEDLACHGKGRGEFWAIKLRDPWQQQAPQHQHQYDTEWGYTQGKPGSILVWVIFPSVDLVSHGGCLGKILGNGTITTTSISSTSYLLSFYEWISDPVNSFICKYGMKNENFEVYKIT